MLNNKIRICRQLYSDIILGLSFKPFMKDLTKSWHLINEWFAFQDTLTPTLYDGFDECYAIHYTLTPTLYYGFDECYAIHYTLTPTLYYGFDECYAIHYTLTPTPACQYAFRTSMTRGQVGLSLRERGFSHSCEWM